jgi:zinc protease
MCVVVGSLTAAVLGADAGRVSGQAEPAVVPQLTVETFTLPNGLQVALSPDPTAPRTTVSVAYHVGSKNERAGLTGFAHFFEHMMFRGTKHVPNFDIPLQEAGGQPNAFTSEDVTVYFETVPNAYVQRVLYLEAERMAFLADALDQDKFDTEREVVKNERRQVMENVPYGLADETLSYHLFPPGHPYSWSVIGSMQDLDRATLEDLRQFFFEFYHPGNATLTLVGGFDPAEVRAWIEQYFGVLAAGPPLARVRVPAVVPVERREVQRDAVEFPRVYWAWPTVAETHPDAPALDLLARLLADGDASRLVQSLVIHAQVAVDASARSDARELGGLFQITATAAPDQTIAQIEALLAEQVQRCQTQAPAAEELARVQAKYRTSLLTGLASPLQRNLVIALGLAQHRDPHYYRTMFERYALVTPQEIQRVAQQYLTSQKCVLVVEPTGEGEAESPAVLGGPLADAAPPPRQTPRAVAPAGDWTVLPAASERRGFVTPAFSRHTLSNGLTVWVCPWRTLPLVSARLLVATGSADDPPGRAGLAQLTAELWRQGTAELNSTQFAEALDALGTSLDVSAMTDTTVLSFTVEARSLDPVWDLVGPLLAQPRLDDVDFRRERQLQVSQLRSGPDDVSWIADRVFPTLSFGAAHPYASPQLGYITTVEALARDQVQTFYRERFSPSNSVLILVGDVVPDQLLARLETQLAAWKRTAVQAAPAPVPQPAVGETVFVVDKPGAVQSVLVVGRTWHDRRHDSYFATRIGNRVLGGDFLSRINQNLRERNGFTYGARSGFEYLRTLGHWTVQTSVRAEVTGAALREIFAELTAVADQRPLTEDEVRTGREAESNGFPETFETPARIAGALAQLAIYQLPDDYFDHFVDHLMSTDAAAVTQALSQLVDRATLRTLVVGDRSVIEPLLREAGFEHITYLDVDGRPASEPTH